MSSSLTPGSVLRSRYKVDKVINETRFVNIYHVHDIHMQGRTWAMRETLLLTSDPQEKNKIIKKFNREASFIASLSHPNLATVVDFFIDGNYLYIMREFIPGDDLDHMAKIQQAPFQEEDVVHWAIQLTDLLNYLYMKKLPASFFKEFNRSNIIVTPKNSVKLIDIGLANIFFVDTALETLARIGAGEYPAPEQFAEENAFDLRSLVYSVGSFMYHLLTNVNPASSPFDLQPVSLLNPEASRQVQEVIRKSTEAEAKKRYASLLDLKKALQSLSKSKGGNSRKPSGAKKSGSLLFGFLILALLGILISLAYFFFFY